MALGLFALVLAASGCAGTKQALEKQVEELESRIVTLRAENANLTARNASLDDRLLVLDTRQTACREEERRSRQLRVVRLTAENTDVDEPIEHQPAVRAPANGPGEEQRPVLRLAGTAPRASGPAGAPATLPPVPVGGDNLGVVPLGGARAEDPAEDAAMALFQEGYRSHANGDHAAALELLARFLGEHPRHPFADNALFWRGECYLSLSSPLQAIGEWERMLRRYPKSEKAASALYRIGFAYDRLGDAAKAGEYYFKVVERHPGTDAARKASRRVATIRGTGRAGGLTPASATR